MHASASQTTVLIMAGGTGGHVFPALAVANALRSRQVAVEWLGTRAGIEARVVPEHGIKLHYLSVRGLRGKSLFSRVAGLFKAAASVISAWLIVRRLKPVCVIGLGGYVAGPGGVAAWLARIPLVIHEQNAVAGTTNRLLTRLARQVLTGYPIELGGEKNRYIGNPVRSDITALPEPAVRWENRSGALRLLVLGGSQGALAINRVVLETLTATQSQLDIEVWHQTGSAHIDSIRDQYNKLGLPVKAEAFIENMAEAYSWADLVLCRAGALTVAELTAAGVGSWLVPLPQAIDDHQRANAQWLQSNGAGEILEQATLTSDVLKNKLQTTAQSRKTLLEMAQAARRLAKPDAAGVAAGICLEYAHG